MPFLILFELENIHQVQPGRLGLCIHSVENHGWSPGPKKVKLGSLENEVNVKDTAQIGRELRKNIGGRRASSARDRHDSDNIQNKKKVA